MCYLKTVVKKGEETEYKHECSQETDCDSFDQEECTDKGGTVTCTKCYHGELDKHYKCEGTYIVLCTLKFT